MPLFFQFLRNSILLLVLCLLVPGIIAMASNATGGACKAGLCDTGLFTTLSVANIQNKPSFLAFLGIANCVQVLAACLFIQYMRFTARKCKLALDRRNVSPSRYSLLV